MRLLCAVAREHLDFSLQNNEARLETHLGEIIAAMHGRVGGDRMASAGGVVVAFDLGQLCCGIHNTRPFVACSCSCVRLRIFQAPFAFAFAFVM